MMRGRCVYIVLGQPRLEKCIVEGGVVVSGSRTSPQISSCSIHSSWGSGLHMTDYCQGSLRESVVAKSRRHGILLDRNARTEVVANRFSQNSASGIRVFCGAGPAATLGAGKTLQSLQLKRIRENRFDENGEGNLSTTPRYADSEELHVD